MIAVNDCTLRATFVADLGTSFPVDDTGELGWILQVKEIRDRRKRVLELSQELYVKDLLHRFGLLIGDPSRQYDSPCDSYTQLTVEQRRTLGSPEYDAIAIHREDDKSLVGVFLWLANMTRYELLSVSSHLSWRAWYLIQDFSITHLPSGDPISDFSISPFCTASTAHFR